jgi:hypothetical protein
VHLALRHKPITDEDVERGNSVLKFCIACLKGENIVSRLSGRIQIALILRKELAFKGLWWQVKVLEAWIHRAQRGDFDP